VDGKLALRVAGEVVRRDGYHRDIGACHLCKSPLHIGDKRGGHLKMREERAFQEKESRNLLKEKVRRLEVLNGRSAELQSVAKLLRSQFSEFRHRVDPLDAEIGNLMQRIGYLEKSVEDLHRKSALAEIVNGKIETRNVLSTKISSLNDYLAFSENSRRARSEKIAASINELCADALRRDLPQEEEFQNAEVIEYDFGRNSVTVNGRSKFSASLATYLKNSFLFSLFELSLEDPEVRWPRFILLDNIEDKGMQPKRSANFQEYVVAKTAKSEVEHQVIMTTSMISENLENSPYCVGPHYSENNKTLAFSSGVPKAPE
jgi:hypothetical protein